MGVVEPPVLEPLLEPLELPEPMLPLLEPVLGVGLVVGEGVELLLLPLVPPLAAPELDLLKWASHSAREIWPSLFVSTDEKLGAELEPLALEPDRPPLELPVVLPEPLDMPDEPLELEPDAEGVEEPLELEPDADGVDEDEDLSLLVLEEELCAIAALESANNAAAVATLRSFIFNIGRVSFG